MKLARVGPERQSSPETEGYYDKQDEAVAGGRELARKTGVSLHIHGEDGTVRDQV